MPGPEKLIITGLSLVIFVGFFFSGCSKVPFNCPDLVKELMKNSFEESSSNDYYINSVQLISNPVCLNIGPRYGLDMKNGQWIPCNYTISMTPSGSFNSNLNIIQCYYNKCSTKLNNIDKNRYWQNKSVLWDIKDVSLAPNIIQWNINGKEEGMTHLHSLDIENETNPVFYVGENSSYPTLVFKKPDSIQCKAYATTSKGQSDNFFFTKDNWGKWSISPEHSGTVQFEIQSTGFFNTGSESVPQDEN